MVRPVKLRAAALASLILFATAGAALAQEFHHPFAVGADEGAVARGDPQAREPGFQFNRAVVVVGNAGDPARIRNILDQRARHRRRQRLGLAASRAGEHHAMTLLHDRGRLLRVALEFSQGLK